MSSKLDALQKRVDRLYAKLPEENEQTMEMDQRYFTDEEWQELQAFLASGKDRWVKLPDGEYDYSHNWTVDELRTYAEWQELQQARAKEGKWRL